MDLLPLDTIIVVVVIPTDRCATEDFVTELHVIVRYAKP